MGALTSKPYAFTARPWELRVFKGVDCFDSLGSSIRLDLRGLEIMRILPRINESLNEEWITDRVRFSYDALRRQRITVPLLKKSSQQFLKSDWINAYLFLIKKLFLSSSTHFDLIIGKLVSFNGHYSMLAFIKQLQRFNNKLKVNLCFFENLNLKQNNFVPTYRTDYLFNSIVRLKSADLLVLLNTNLRLQSPLINIRVRKAVTSRTMLAFSWGAYSNQTYPITYLGNSVTTLLNLSQGRHPLVRYLVNSTSPFFIYSSNLNINNSIANTFSNRLKSQLSNAFVFYLAQTTASLMAFDYGILESVKCSVYGNNKLSSQDKNLWILADDEVCFEPINYSSIVYSGHHGDRNALLSNLVLPATYGLEERSTTLNLLGELQSMELVSNPPSSARTPFSILNGLFAVLINLLKLNCVFHPVNFVTLRPLFNMYLGYLDSKSNLNLLNSRLQPFFIPELENGLPYAFNSQQYAVVTNSFVSSYSLSYYADNAVLRASHVMALSMNRFQRYNSNFN